MFISIPALNGTNNSNSAYLRIVPKIYNANLWNANKAEVSVLGKDEKLTARKISDSHIARLSIGSQFFATAFFLDPNVYLRDIKKSGKLLNTIGIASTIFPDYAEFKTYSKCRSMWENFISVNHMEISPDNRYVVIDYNGWSNVDIRDYYKACNTTTIPIYQRLGIFFLEIDSNAQIIKRFNIHSDIPSTFFNQRNNTHITPNSKFFVNFNDKELFIWELNTGKRVNQFQVDHPIRDVYFSPDSRFIATINFNPNDDYGKGLVYLLELNSGKVFKKLKGHVNEIYSLTFSPNGKYLVTISTDSICLWEVNSGELINAIEWHKYVINNLSFTQVDKAVLSASKNNTTQKLIEHAKKIVPRCLTKEQREEFFLLPRQSHTLIETGEKLAQIGQINEAIALFEQARELEYCHKFDPKKRALLIYANTLFETGEKMAQTGHIEKALAQFKQAQALVSYDFAPKNNDQYLEQREILAIQEKREQIIASFPQQQGQIDPEFEFIASLVKRKSESYAIICKYGSLYGYAAKVIEFCDKAVALATKGDCHIRDSRALARALTGNTKGAIKDIQSFEASDCEDYDESKQQRQRWIEALRRGENPFTPEELERLRSESN